MKLKSYDTIYMHDYKSRMKVWSFFIVVAAIAILFLPWTQNIKAKGYVTTLYQEERPQEINSPIPGRIAQWFVKEGDWVQKGDTIVQLTEIKEDYLDPKLVQRTQQQLEAKKGSITFYNGKIKTNEAQIKALENSRRLKLEQLNNKLIQLENKLTSEVAELSAAENEFTLAQDQLNRQQKMFNDGLVSQTQLQQRSVSFQNAQAKQVNVENKISITKQEIINTKIEKSSVEQEYLEKTSKIEGDIMSSMSQIATSQGDVAKMENSVTNYSIRNSMYIILAPQDGQIVQAKKSGIGEILKDGERITLIVPKINNYAVEIFVRPVDLPLISVGQRVRFLFDGFPAIVFSGWPQTSYGTFGGRVIAYENTINPNGMFRVLVAQDPKEKKWPIQLRVGGGTQAIALLKDVPIWYELWRNINGFPPDFYQENMKVDSKKESSK